MPRTKKILALAGAVLIAGGVGAGAAQGHEEAKAPVTLTFTAKSTAGVSFGRTAFGGTEILKNKNGKKVGVDVISGVFQSESEGTIYASIAQKGGLINGEVSVTSPNTYKGRVTGGQGKYKGATGTITAKELANGNTKITVTYQLP